MTTYATGSKLLHPEKILTEAGVGIGMRVADLGCGNGYFTLTAAQMVGSRGQIYAVDILKSCLATVKREAGHNHLLNIKLVWSNLEKAGATRIPANSLDMTLIIHALYQAHDKIAFLREAVRLLKPGGKLLIVDWKKHPTPIGPPESDRMAEDEVRQLVDKIRDLKELKGFTPGEYHFAMVYEKK